MISAVPKKDRSRPFTEAGVWHAFGEGWRPLWAGFRENGFSVEWHDFESKAPVDLAESFHPDSVEICLNLEGEAEFSTVDKKQALPRGSATFYSRGRQSLNAHRLPEQRHQFITIEIARDFLKRRIGKLRAGLHPQIQPILAGNRNKTVIAETRKLTAEQQRMVPALRNSLAPLAGRRVWFESKVLELMSEFFFIPSEKEFFCERQKRVTQERVQKVVELLSRNLAEPPDLMELGRRVGCSPFYLSRTFSQEIGTTIPQYLRQLRMERAAELLRSGKFNVTEAAMEVGYSSLSHFSQAFCQTMGCCPNIYPLLRAFKKIL